MRNVTRSARTNPPLLRVSDSPVLVKEDDLEMLQQRLLESEAVRLVMVVLPPAGPPVTIAVGQHNKIQRSIAQPMTNWLNIMWCLGSGFR